MSSKLWIKVCRCVQYWRGMHVSAPMVSVHPASSLWYLCTENAKLLIWFFTEGFWGSRCFHAPLQMRVRVRATARLSIVQRLRIGPWGTTQCCCNPNNSEASINHPDEKETLKQRYCFLPPRRESERFKRCPLSVAKFPITHSSTLSFQAVVCSPETSALEHWRKKKVLMKTLPCICLGRLCLLTPFLGWTIICTNLFARTRQADYYKKEKKTTYQLEEAPVSQKQFSNRKKKWFKAFPVCFLDDVQGSKLVEFPLF